MSVRSSSCTNRAVGCAAGNVPSRLFTQRSSWLSRCRSAAAGREDAGKKSRKKRIRVCSPRAAQPHAVTAAMPGLAQARIVVALFSLFLFTTCPCRQSVHLGAPHGAAFPARLAVLVLLRFTPFSQYTRWPRLPPDSPIRSVY